MSAEPARQVDSVLEALWHGWTPEPELTVTEWADEHRRLSPKASAEPGPWRTARTPYLAEVMDCLSASSPVRQVVFMKGSQIGATEAGSNWIGYAIHHSPGPMLLLEPTLDSCKKVSQERLEPMFEASPALEERLGESTTLRKDFEGGVLYMAGAKSAAGLRMVPVGKLFADEIDEYPGDVNNQGDPLSLAVRRTTNFPRRKLYFVSTPTTRGFSRIEAEFKLTDQRRFELPCPECGAFDFLTWDGRDWLEGSAGNHYRVEWDEGAPLTARLVCPACEARIPEWRKQSMLAGGRWRPTVACADPNLRGYHLSGLYSPWQTWAAIATEFLEIKANPPRLQVWVNTTLGETWEERGTRVDADVLLARRARYGKVRGTEVEAEVPATAGVLVASVDQQDDRLEVLVTGFGAGETTWPIAHSQFYGDPGHDDVWREVDTFVSGRFVHESGQEVPIELVVVDSGGHHTDMAYKFTALRRRRRIVERGNVHTQLMFPVKGSSLQGRELVLAPSRKNRYGVKLYPIGTDAAKDLIFSRLRIGKPGPGYFHMPGWFDEEHVAQLLSEKALRRWVRGKGWIRQWEKTRDRNEMLDLSVYALAGLHILGGALIRNLEARAAKWAAPPDGKAAQTPDALELRQALDDDDAAPPPASPAGGKNLLRRRTSWTNRWRS